MCYDQENECIMASMEGDVDMNLLREFVKSMTQELENNNCNKMLNDVRKINLKLSTLEIYNLPKFIMEAGIKQTCKRALVVNNDFDDVSFFETVSLNQAQYVKIFQDPDEALSWLRDG
jgi:hypothetical protein